MDDLNQQLRALPSIDKLLTLSAAQTLIATYGREPVINALRGVLDLTRQHIRTGNHQASTDPDTLITAAAHHLDADFRPTLRPVINATGVIIHTNLGRAPLSQAAQDAMIAVAQGYSTLEYDLETGKRGSRLVHAAELLRQITGAEAALVVNNNAAATVLLLAALARGKEVIVSRGQLVEIGGGFRVPDIMRQSHAKLIEVGTTNRTRIKDYEQAITPDTALLMRVHSSNFKQIGFTESTSLDAMATLAHQHQLYCVDDLGSGALLDTSAFGLEPEPTVQASMAAGADVIAFSGDKLLGGPQAGILVGKRDLIDLLKRHPLARAIRADKLCLAALTATLDHYRKGEALTQIPVWQMISRTTDSIRETAEHWQTQINAKHPTLAVDVIAGESTVGGGSLPGATLPTWLLRITLPHADNFTERLRQAHTPVIARILVDAVVFDPRTVLRGQESILLKMLLAVIQT